MVYCIAVSLGCTFLDANSVLRRRRETQYQTGRTLIPCCGPLSPFFRYSTYHSFDFYEHNMPQTTVTLGSLNRVRLTITCHHFVIIHQLTVINPSKSQTFCCLLTQNFTLKQSHQRFKFRVQPEPDIFKTETLKCFYK